MLGDDLLIMLNKPFISSTLNIETKAYFNMISVSKISKTNGHFC